MQRAGQGSDMGNKKKTGTGQELNRGYSNKCEMGQKSNRGERTILANWVGQESDMGKRAKITNEAEQGSTRGNKNNSIKWSRTRIRLGVNEQAQCLEPFVF